MTAAVRIGVLNDMADGPPPAAPATGRPAEPGEITDWLRRELDAVAASGRLPVPVELVHAYGLGLPAGTAQAVERAYSELASQGVVMIVGPAIGDNALIATPLAQQHRIPTINWAGAERARNDYMFHHQVGSYEEEAPVIARHIAGTGAKRICVIYDVSPIGEGYLKGFKIEAPVLGMEIVAEERITPLTQEASREVGNLLAAKPDFFVYLGLGKSAPAVAYALHAQGWQGPRMMNSAGIWGYYGDFAQKCDGWLYIDMHSDRNRTLAKLRKDMKLPPQAALEAAKGYDVGRLVAEGLARAPELTREGVRIGLEQVKWLPAAEGEDGTLLSFGLQDRGALHGRYLVIRQWLAGETVEVAAN